MIGYQSLAAILTGIGTAILASGLLPVLENLFRVTTDISWLEMADLNHPVLKRLEPGGAGNLSSQPGGRESSRKRRRNPSERKSHDVPGAARISTISANW